MTGARAKFVYHIRNCKRCNKVFRSMLKFSKYCVGCKKKRSTRLCVFDCDLF